MLIAKALDQEENAEEMNYSAVRKCTIKRCTDYVFPSHAHCSQKVTSQEASVTLRPARKNYLKAKALAFGESIEFLKEQNLSCECKTIFIKYLNTHFFTEHNLYSGNGL